MSRTPSAITMILNALKAHPDSPLFRARYLRRHIELLGNMDLCEEIILELMRANGQEPELWSPARASADALNRDAKALAPTERNEGAP